MNSWINYHHLYYFMTVVEQGSVSKAAQKLRLGQPTVSAQLKQLEEHLSVSLFDRQHRKLILTEHGKVAFDYAKNIFKLGSEMYEVLHDQVKPSKINVQIGALDGISKQIVFQLAQKALNIAPCTLHLVEGKFDELFHELSAHKIDIMLSNFLPRTREANGILHRSVARNPVSVFGAPKFKGLKKHYPQSLHQQKFALPTYDSQMRADFEHWLKVQKLEIDTVVESQDIALNKLLTLNGVGLICAAHHTVEQQMKSGHLIEIGKVHGIHEELFLITVQRKRKNPIAQELMKQFVL